MGALQSWVPNFLSISRILVACGIWFYPDRRVLLALIVWGAFSDWADGYLARRWRMSTKLGALLDPIGDKVFISSLVVFLYSAGSLPAWWVLVVLLRDGFILLGGLVVLRFSNVRDMPPTWISKFNTALQMLVLLMAVWPLPYIEPMMIVTALTAVFSGFQYAVFLCRTLALAR